jgi:hypothetical protein
VLGSYDLPTQRPVLVAPKVNSARGLRHIFLALYTQAEGRWELFNIYPPR